MKKLLLALIFSLVVGSSVFASELLFEYGFEDWDTDVATTPNYCYVTDWCAVHQSITEVTTTWDSLTAYEGSNWFLWSISGTLSPSQSGISSASSNAHDVIGNGAGSCGNNTWVIEDEPSHVFFARVKMRMSSRSTITTAYQKLIRFYEGAGDDPFLALRFSSGDMKLRLFYRGWEYGPTINGADDGNWHTYAMYVDYENDVIKAWYDVAVPTLENATITHSFVGNMTEWPPNYLTIPGNWSDITFAGVVWQGIDDIEVWDGLPDEGDSLTISDTSQSQTADNSVLTAAGILIADDNAQNQSADNITIIEYSPKDIVPIDSPQAQTADNITLNAGFTGGLVIQYGFEDAENGLGDASPGDGYIFGTDYDPYWNDDHLTATEIITNGDSDCAGNAQAGTKYLHVEKYTGAFSDCLNAVAGSANSHSNIGGGDYNYPTGTSDITDISTEITSETLTIRLYMRVTGDWTSNQINIDSGYGNKFLKIYGEDGSTSIKLLNSDDSTTPAIDLYIGDNDFNAIGIDWQDGEWHPWAIQVVRNNDDNSANNITINVWVDDWGMSGTVAATNTGTVAGFGGSYDHIAFSGTWNGPSPTTFIGYDIDTFELWDGSPNEDDVLIMTDTFQSQTADSPTPTAAVTLTIADESQAQSSDNSSLSSAGTISLVDTAQNQTADSPVLVASNTLVIADVSQEQVSRNLEIFAVMPAPTLSGSNFGGGSL